jgi:membrane protein YdbS with pleckstrin-like domain
MIEIICDNCERTFSVENDQAGSKVPCPLCGDINRVPAEGDGGAREAMRPARSAPPPTREPEGEREICVVRPAMFRAHPFRYLLLVLLFAGGIGLAVVVPIEGSLPPWLSWLGLGAAAVGMVLWLIWWIGSTRWMKLSITNKRTVRHEGLIRRHSTEVLHDHVRSVDINQSFMQRILGVGYIGIDSAGQDDIEIEMRDIPNPYEVKKVIDTYRKM